MEAYDRLVKLVEDIAEEVRKAEGGNKAAGTRVRKAMQDVKKAAQDVRVAILDRYPGCDVTVNDRSVRVPGLKKTNRLQVTRIGNGLNVRLNGQSVEATRVSDVDLPGVRLALSNNRDEYGRADTNKFPTIYSIRVGPAAATAP